MQIPLLIFVVLTIVGAFSAWRRSPLYSFKTTLKLAGCFILIVAVGGAALFAIATGLVNRSPVVLGIAVFLAIIVLSCRSSILVVRITDAHVAQLPASVKLVSINRHKVRRSIWRLAILLLIATAAVLVLPADWRWLPAAVGGFAVLVCGPTLSIAYMMARRNDRGMSAVIANPWVHWQYSPDEWAQWAKNQKQYEEAREGPWSWKRALLFVLLCVGLFAVGSLLTGESVRENLMIVSGLACVVILLVLVAYWLKRTGFDRRFRRLLAASPETWFGDEGVFCNGEYTPWILSGRYLLKATAALDQPARMTMVFQSFNGTSSTEIIQRALIPDGHIADLLTLQRKLNSSCPTASIHLIS